MQTTIRVAQLLELKVFAPLVSAVAAILQATQTVKLRLKRVKSLRNRAGSLGWLFMICFEVPQHIHFLFFGAVAVAGIATLWGFVAGVLDAYQLVQIGPINFWLWKIYEKFAIPLVVVWGVGTLVVQFNLIPRVLIWFFELLGAGDSPSLVGAKEFANFNDKAQPLMPRMTGINAVADDIIRKLEVDFDFDKNRAKEPQNLATDTKANVALLGCLIEKFIHQHGLQEGRSWGSFYHCLAAAQGDEHSIFSKEFIVEFQAADETYLDIVRRLTAPCLAKLSQPTIPDSASLGSEIDHAIRMLKTRYGGTASGLARRNWPLRGFSMRKAWKRARVFPLLDAASMLPQCLKLMLVWRVWPGIKPKTFVQPFSKDVAAYLLDAGAIAVPDDLSIIEAKNEASWTVFRSVVQQVTSKVLGHLTSGAPSSRYAKIRERIEASTDLPFAWEVAYRVDLLLWSISQEKAKGGGLTKWKLESVEAIKRK